MKKIFSGLLICLIMMNCSKKENTNLNTPYVISKKDILTNISNKPRDKNIPPPPPIPGWLAYGTNTFIIDTDSKIYYFQRNKIGRICINGRFDTIPYFIDLQPKDLIEIPNNAISDFVKLNYKDDFRNLTFISSKLDTLKSENYFVLVKAIESSLKENDFYFIRRTTQEEDTVLKYKKNNISYYSEEIKWDKNRITFPFIKPILKPQQTP
ncbi:hypothetical protein [Flavobacterium fluviatile]|uniref:hypothetical protein n=1 Tax=Flavobacterium fluviatile TaxID=1862387 RepID=UPI0013CFF1AB|nr:hypothetical protein [Flavobacterium fluviatile]